MKIGDKFIMRPSVCTRDDGTGAKFMACTVVYIHPQHRFYTVEFKSEVSGAAFRESFSCPDRPEIIREQPAVRRKWRWDPSKLRPGGLYTKG